MFGESVSLFSAEGPAVRPMPPELRRVFRPLMTLLVVSFVVALAADEPFPRAAAVTGDGVLPTPGESGGEP